MSSANQTITRHFKTPSGLIIKRASFTVDGPEAISALARDLDRAPGLLLVSGVDRPGRYTRCDLGACDPVLTIRGQGRQVTITAENEGGAPLLLLAQDVLRSANYLDHLEHTENRLSLSVKPAGPVFDERQRTRVNSSLSVLRSLMAAIRNDDEAHFGLYGAFGYDLVFQFEDLMQQHQRAKDTHDLVLFAPKRIVVVDHASGHATEHRYRFEYGSTNSGVRVPIATAAAAPAVDPPGQQQGPSLPGRPAVAPSTLGMPDGHPAQCTPSATEFEDIVRTAKRSFAAGQLFEVTPSRSFTVPCDQAPSALFNALCKQNPAPFGFLANLAQDGHLIGASPEMFVRVQGSLVETCPIAGTIARGADAFEDADQIRTLLKSQKDEDELTMCTDVDRNDKARVCQPGSIRVIARRDIESYSRLIHTVDHVAGELADDMDAIDAFLTHCWAVTVTGAPKRAAMQFIEQHEVRPRGFYAGAIGCLGVDGHLNTGLVIRTIHLRDQQATVRAGATLLHASAPRAERLETELKASALLAVLGTGQPKADAVDASDQGNQSPSPHDRTTGRQGPSGPAGLRRHTRPNVIVIDHQDSFVHMLADQFKDAGARVTTVRTGFDSTHLADLEPSLVVLSPGPGRPDDFGMHNLLTRIAELKLPTFGVCLGLQAMVEHCGGTLAYLPQPRHGSPSALDIAAPAHPLFAGVSQGVSVGRYHSLHAPRLQVPRQLSVLATSADDGCVMAVAHKHLPWAAVQFHPESIMSSRHATGALIIRNAMGYLLGRQPPSPASTLECYSPTIAP